MTPTDSTRISDIAIVLSIFGSPQLSDRFTNNFFRCGHAFTNLVQTRFAQRDHAVVDRLLPQFKCGSTDQDQLTDLVGDFHHFVKSDSPFVAGVITRRTSLALIGLDRPGFLCRETHLDQRLGRSLMFLLAVFADTANQSLCLDEVYAGG